jgi:arsenite-transporting ATPase
MRIIVYTGKGGVGKTSMAAATALQSAQKGLKTLVVSTDPAHSLGDSFDMDLSAEPKEIHPNLWAQEIDTIHEVEKGWGKIQEYIKSVFDAKAVNDITAEELTVFPGIEDLLSLLRLLDYCRMKTFDVIIVDCAPTGETLAMLSFPDIMRWWMERIFPFQKKAVKIVRPFAEPILGIPLPTNQVLDEIENIYDQLDQMRRILSDRSMTSIRIVVNPEKMVIKEAQRSFTYLNLYDFNIDKIIVNKVIPDDVSDNYFKVWRAIQKKYLELIAESFAPVPILYAPLFEREMVGLEMLDRLGQKLFAATDPVGLDYNTRT